ncbi:hypothetical protein HBB16_17305 [Pseudonocardia sp. MCCB 268]|nr:hypothetical protein [Pseudonocardia cytotoxica]
MKPRRWRRNEERVIENDLCRAPRAVRCHSDLHRPSTGTWNRSAPRRDDRDGSGRGRVRAGAPVPARQPAHDPVPPALRPEITRRGSGPGQRPAFVRSRAGRLRGRRAGETFTGFFSSPRTCGARSHALVGEDGVVRVGATVTTAWPGCSTASCWPQVPARQRPTSGPPRRCSPPRRRGGQGRRAGAPART